MEKIYYYVGLAVTWLFIAAVAVIVAILIGAVFWRAWLWLCKRMNIANFISFYIRRRVIEPESLRWFYANAKKNRKYITLYRRRNIRRAKLNKDKQLDEIIDYLS